MAYTIIYVTIFVEWMKCFTGDVSFLYFHREISEPSRPIDVKLCCVIGISAFSCIIQVWNFGTSPHKKNLRAKNVQN